MYLWKKKQSKNNVNHANISVNELTLSMYETPGKLTNETIAEETSEGRIYEAPIANDKSQNLEATPETPIHETIAKETYEGRIYEATIANVQSQNLEVTPETPIHETPTANDNFKNRYSEFLLYCLTEFNQYACLAILVSTDKNNAKTGQLSKYLGQAVESGLTIGLACSGVPKGAAIGKGIGKLSGEIVGGLIKEYEKSKKHKKGKLAEHMLKSFEPDDPKWISFLLDCFSDIFVW